ncbi:hypothetical protein ANCCAN_03340 [Ancylostoma caninum]|uniref:Uncharacterized protein n=1 Tax=Ancylostoma caninum TaxID=29170 RepID=A0A368H1J7_ANCCA|nr:hypothetical protein ANCCAN_03340 [Ancylostoma caninum]
MSATGDAFKFGPLDRQAVSAQRIPLTGCYNAGGVQPIFFEEVLLESVVYCYDVDMRWKSKQ